MTNNFLPLAILDIDYVTPSGQVNLLFATSSGVAYQIWYSADLTDGSFTKIIDVFGASGTTATSVIIEPSTFGAGIKGFFRVRRP